MMSGRTVKCMNRFHCSVRLGMVKWIERERALSELAGNRDWRNCIAQEIT